MSILFKRDDATRRVTLTVQGTLTAEELIAAGDRQAAEGAWFYAVLLDARGREGPPLNAVMVHTWVEHNARLSAEHGPSGPFAFVPRDDAGYGIGRMFESLSAASTGRLVKVCRFMEDARAWLDQLTP